jgi:hypothetical protein
MKPARTTILPAVALALLGLTSSTETRAADPPPPTLRATDFSPYEQESIDDALRQLKETRDDAPEGKVVEGVDIITLEVFEERDPVPRFVNVFHWTTRASIVDREVLVRPGERYSQVLVDESVRNLRKLAALSLVVAVPIKGTAPDRVRILVITKDVWSLRLNSNVAASSGGLESLIIQPSEINAFGSHQRATLLYAYEPLATTLGAGYRIPRVAGTRVIVSATANMILGHSGKLEGSSGTLVAYQPLYSALTKWAWDAQVLWDDEIIRRYVNAQLATFDAKATPGNDRIPWQYDTRRYFAQDSVTRSFGWSEKHDFSLGGTVDLRSYRAENPAGYAPAALAEFAAREMPRSDARVGPFLQYHAYTTRFMRVLDLETLGLQEDFRLGHDFYARVYPIARALGSSRDLIGFLAAAQYTLPIKDGLASAVIESSTEAQSTELTDASLSATLHLVTPRLGFGRVVYNGHVFTRYRNYLNRLTYLGGNTRLRGYPTNFFVGKDIINSNLEFRTRPLEILSCELGLAAFYDVGDAFDGFENMHPKHAVGAGLRVLFPQLDRLVFRGDIGFPLGAGARIPGVSPAAFFIAFEQAFGVPSLASNGLVSGP